jgi:hypothetical protein
VIWLFAVIMVAQIVIMHQQWQLFTTGLRKLNANAVLRPLPSLGGRDEQGNRAGQRSLLGPPGPGTVPPRRRLAEHVLRVNRLDRRRARSYTTVYLAAAFVLAGLLVWGERYGLFRVLVPDGLPAAEAEAWRRAAYDSWWASTTHPAGALAYFLLVTVAIYLIIVQTHVGVRVAGSSAAETASWSWGKRRRSAG